MKLQLLAHLDVFTLLFTLVNPHAGVFMSAFRSAPVRSVHPLLYTTQETQYTTIDRGAFKDTQLTILCLFVFLQQSQDNPPEEAVQ